MELPLGKLSEHVLFSHGVAGAARTRAPLAAFEPAEPVVVVMTVAVGTLEYFVPALANHEQYCTRHGYAHVVLKSCPADRHPSWCKIIVAHALLKSGLFTEVFQVDADSLVMELSQPTSSLPAGDFVLSCSTTT